MYLSIVLESPRSRGTTTEKIIILLIYELVKVIFEEFLTSNAHKFLFISVPLQQ